VTLKEAAELIGIPKSIVERLHADGLISDPVEPVDLRGLMIVEHMRGSVWYLKRLMAPLSKRKRPKLVSEGDLSRVESYVLGCYLNAKPGERFSIQEMVQRVRHYYRVNMSREDVKRIRNMAYERRRRRKAE